jgi:hypothetical protein
MTINHSIYRDNDQGDDQEIVLTIEASFFAGQRGDRESPPIQDYVKIESFKDSNGSYVDLTDEEVEGIEEALWDQAKSDRRDYEEGKAE